MRFFFSAPPKSHRSRFLWCSVIYTPNWATEAKKKTKFKKWAVISAAFGDIWTLKPHTEHLRRLAYFTRLTSRPAVCLQGLHSQPHSQLFPSSFNTSGVIICRRGCGGGRGQIKLINEFFHLRLSAEEPGQEAGWRREGGGRRFYPSSESSSQSRRNRSETVYFSLALNQRIYWFKSDAIKLVTKQRQSQDLFSFSLKRTKKKMRQSVQINFGSLSSTV